MAKSEVEKYQPGPKRSLIKAAFDLEAAKRNYQALLQNLAATTVTKDNVNDDLSKEGREVLKDLIESKDEQSKEPLQWHRDIMSVFKELHDPLKEQVDRIAAEKKAVAQQLQKERDQQVAEQTRVNNAKQSIIDFTNKIANLIGAAKTDDDIVLIEKLIGSEKTKKTVYQEFIPDLIDKCDALRPTIKTQKDNIRELQRIEQEEKEALQSGNIIATTELQEKKEQVQAVIAETTIRLHEAAFDQATTIDIVVPEIAEVIPKGRTNWKWRVDDIKLLQKKMPEMVKLVPDEDAISNWLSIKKKDGSLKDKTQETVNGVTFYNDQSFK